MNFVLTFTKICSNLNIKYCMLKPTTWLHGTSINLRIHVLILKIVTK